MSDKNVALSVWRVAHRKAYEEYQVVVRPAWKKYLETIEKAIAGCYTIEKKSKRWQLTSVYRD